MLEYGISRSSFLFSCFFVNNSSYMRIQAFFPECRHVPLTLPSQEFQKSLSSFSIYCKALFYNELRNEGCFRHLSVSFHCGEAVKSSQPNDFFNLSRTIFGSTPNEMELG